jgi:hypothetical protein
MSLLKRLTLTSRKLEANQANARLSRGPVTAEGIERIREAHLHHGFYSKAIGEIIRALGEKPEDFDRLLAALNETWQPASDYELVLIRRLARALWRVERADRIQEAMTVEQAERVSRNLEERAAEAGSRHKRRIAALEKLLEQSRHTGLYFTLADLQDIEVLAGSRPKGRVAEISYLVWRLMDPADPAARAVAREAMALDKGLAPLSGILEEGQGGAAGPGNIATPSGSGVPARLAPAAGGDRDHLRARLQSLVRQEIETEQADYRRKRDRDAREITPAAMDAALAPTDPKAEFMLRCETAAFRQVKELTELLIRFRQFRTQGSRPDGAPVGEPAANSHIENEGKSHDVAENKGSSSDVRE